MTNFQVYKKTLSFSFLSFAVSLGCLLLIGGCTVLGFVFTQSNPNAILVGVIIGFIVGIIGAALVSVFVLNRIKAAQIAMMAKGVTEGNLPDNTFKAGFEEIRSRFGKITVFFFITNAIKSIFRQMGRGITKIGSAVGGDVGGSVGSAIDSAIQILVGYLCDCCLAWILYRQEVNSFKAGCEGAVIFFKNGKTLFRNIGRIFGMGILSFLVIGGAFFGLSFLIFSQFPQFSQAMANYFANLEEPVEFLSTPLTFQIAASVFVGIFMWSAVHSVVGRPFILVGVMRNYLNAGIQNLPTEAEYKELEAKYPRLSKLSSKIQ